MHISAAGPSMQVTSNQRDMGWRGPWGFNDLKYVTGRALYIKLLSWGGDLDMAEVWNSIKRASDKY